MTGASGAGIVDASLDGTGDTPQSLWPWRLMRYSGRQRIAFAVLTVINALIAAWLVAIVEVPHGWLIAYAAVFPLVFRMLIVASHQLRVRDTIRSVGLWRAMRRGEIVLHYQPKISLADGRPLGAEALARWEHPRRGLLLPADWLPATRVHWLGLRFDRYVLEEACRQVHRWRATGLAFGTIHINVSARCVTDERFPRLVGDALARWAVPAPAIGFEITEHAFACGDHAELIVDQLRTAGHVVGLDDFGTEHSSMDRLVRLPIAEIKIDRRFIHHLERSSRKCAVIRAASGLAHSLGALAVAEGLETATERVAAARLGCDVGQGFAISPALPAAELERWLAAEALDDAV